MKPHLFIPGLDNCCWWCHQSRSQHPESVIGAPPSAAHLGSIKSRAGNSPLSGGSCESNHRNRHA